MRPDRSGSSPIIWAFKQGIFAAWRNAVAMSVLLCAMGGILVMYYFWPPGSAILASYGAWQQAGGTLRTGLVAGLAGGVLSELCVIYFRDRGRWTSTHVENLVFGFFLFALSGMVVFQFYQLQAYWFGDGLSWRVIVPKVLVDQFIYSVFISTTYYSLAYRWQELRYSGRRLWPELGPDFVIKRMLPIVVTNWMFWIPAVTLVYSMPLPLQMPLNIFATAIWGVLVAAVAKQPKESPTRKAEVTVAGLPEVPAPSPE